MGVASLVLGIVAIVGSLIGLGVPIGFLCGLLEIVLGAIGKKAHPENSISTAGLVCSIIGTVLSIIGYLACAACISALALS